MIREVRPERGGGLRILRAGIAVGLALAVIPACAWVIGLEDRPGRPEGGDAGEAGAADARPDPNAACDGGLFCDDFDDGGLGQRWTGYADFGLDPVTTFLDAGLALVNGGRSPPRALEAQAQRTGDLTAGFLVNGVDVPAGVTALEASADVKIALIEDARASPGPGTNDGGPAKIYETPRLSVLGLYAPNGATADTAEVVVSSAYVALATGQLLVGGDRYALAAETDYETLTRGTWLHVVVAVGPLAAILARAAEQGRPAPTCPSSSDAVAVVWPSVPSNGVGCLAVSAAFAGLAGKRVAFATGLGLGDRGRAVVTIDNVRVDPIR